MQRTDLLHLSHHETSFEFHPPQRLGIPVVHSIRELYKSIYQIGNKLAKRDKLGIHKQVENEVFGVLRDVLRASFESKQKKLETLEKVRVTVEVLKQLIRAEHELKIIDEKSYIGIQEKLQTISKEINGWIKYLKTQNPPIGGLL